MELRKVQDMTGMWEVIAANGKTIGFVQKLPGRCYSVEPVGYTNHWVTTVSYLRDVADAFAANR